MLPAALKAWGVRRLCFEWDSEPYATQRDAQATQQAQALGCEVRNGAAAALVSTQRCADAGFALLHQVVCPVSHTLYDPRAVIAANGGKPPLTYTARSVLAAGVVAQLLSLASALRQLTRCARPQAFCKVLDKLGAAPLPAADAPAALPPPLADAEALSGRPHGIPTLTALGYPPFPADDAVLFAGGETAGLARLEAQMARKQRCDALLRCAFADVAVRACPQARTEWVAKFEKPLTDPTALIAPLGAATRAKAAPANPFEAAKKCVRG